MDNKFKASKKGKYIQIEYIDYVPPNSTIKNHTDSYMWFLNGDDARRFMKLIVDLEDEIVKQYIENQVHNYKKIIRFYLNVIDSVASGLDVRSKLSLEEFATLIMGGFNRTYVNAKNECQEIIDKGKVEKFSKYSRLVDRYEHLTKLYELDELDVEPISDYIKPDELVVMSNLLDDMLNIIKDKNKI